MGCERSGFQATAASWQGAVQTDLYSRNGVDMAHVYLTPWHGAGCTHTLYDGPVGTYQPAAEPIPTALAA